MAIERRKLEHQSIKLQIFVDQVASQISDLRPRVALLFGVLPLSHYASVLTDLNAEAQLHALE